MDERIKSAFDEIKAEQELKTSTKYFLYEKYNGKHRIKKASLIKRASVCASFCLVFTLCASFFTYSTPVSAISLDGSSSSVELGVNCFDKVVKITCFGYEEETNCLKLKNKDYREAIATVLESSDGYDDSAVLTVSCKNIEKGNRIAEEIRQCHSTDTEVHCHNENSSISAEAHSHGISTGKYSTYMILKEYEPGLTVEQAADLTMKELRERISLYTEGSNTTEGNVTPTSPTASAHHGTSNGNHHHKNESHNGNPPA